jgi:orotidine-5'-phosphate decarboxylase
MNTVHAEPSSTAADNRTTARASYDGGPRVVVALDFPDGHDALALAARLSPDSCAVKVGKELFTSAGPSLIRDLVGRGFRVFLDLKYHDIPNTVASACAAATRLGVWMMNVHASGGQAMLAAARVAVDKTAEGSGRPAPLLIAVTVLTSLSNSDLGVLGLAGSTEEWALRLARLAQANRFDGVVCSAQEAATLRAACGPGFTLVTPGIRPAGVGVHDHARPMTPPEAIAAGADYLVVGRAVTGASDPLAALSAINASIA